MTSDPLEIRAKRGQVRNLWFGTPKIGIFKEIINTTGFPPQEVLHHIKNAGKNSATNQTYLKTRHLELTCILYLEGFSFTKIAECLSNIEGFAIDPKHLRDLSGVRNQDVLEENNPQLYQSRKKQVRISTNSLELYILSNEGKEQVFATVAINPLNGHNGTLQFVQNDNIHFLTPNTREKIILQLVRMNFSPKKIAEALTAYQGFPVFETEVTNTANKCKSTTLLHQGRGARYSLIKIQIEKDRVILIRENDIIEIREDKVFLGDASLVKTKLLTTEILNSDNIISSDPEKAAIEEWNIRPDVGIGRDLCTRYNVTPERLGTLLAHQHHKGILKPAQIHLLKELRQAGLPNREIAIIFTQLEGFIFAENTVRAKVLQLCAVGELAKSRGNANCGGMVDGNFILVVDRAATPPQVIKKVSIQAAIELAIHNNSNNDRKVESGEIRTKIEKRVWNRGFRIYTFCQWHTIPMLGGVEEVAHRMKTSPEKVQEILNSRGGSYPILKPIHLHLIKSLHECGIGHQKIARILTTIENLKFTLGIAKYAIRRGIEMNLIEKTQKNKNSQIRFENGKIFIQDKRTGTIYREIDLFVLSKRVLDEGSEGSFSGFFDCLPPTQKQVDQICNEVNSKEQQTVKDIAMKVGIDPFLAKTIILCKVFKGDEVEFLKKFGPILPSAQIDKIVTLTRFTNYSMNKIAELSDCTRTAVKKYAILNTYFGNELMFKERFHLEKIALSKRQEIVRCNQDRKKFPTIASIAFQIDLPSATVYRVLLKDIYGGDRDALSKDYPGAKIVTGDQEVIIITLVRDTDKSLSEIAYASGVSADVVKRITLSKVYPGNVEKYHQRFPISQLDNDTREKALLLIRETGPSALSQTQIADKLTAEGYPITPDMVSKLSKQVYPDPSIRVKRFPGDVQKRVGEFTHTVCKGLFKQQLRSKNILWCSEVLLPSPSPRWQKVVADGIVVIQPQQFEEIFTREGRAGLPFWEELGLNVNTIKNLQEILLEFTTRKSRKPIQIKADKYAKNIHQKSIRERLVLIVCTDEWFSHERVLPGPVDALNTRVVSMDFVADLFNLPTEARKILKKAIINSRFWHLEDQARLVRDCGFKYESDTKEYLKVKKQQEKNLDVKLAQKHECKYEDDADKYKKAKDGQKSNFARLDPQQTLDKYNGAKNDEPPNNYYLDNPPQDVFTIAQENSSMLRNDLGPLDSGLSRKEKNPEDLEINESRDCEPHAKSP